VDYLDLFNEISLTLQREDISRASSDDEQLSLVNDALSRQRILLIVDNMEEVEDEEDIFSFLRQIPTPSKAIITIRPRADAFYPIILDALNTEQASRLVKQLCEEKSIPNFDSEYLIKQVGGNPMVLKACIGATSDGTPINQIVTEELKNLEDVQKIIDHIYENSFARIRTNYEASYKLVFALSLFSQDATAEALAYVALGKTKPDDAYYGLKILVQFNLINQNQRRYNLHSLTKRYVSTAMRQDTRLAKELQERWKIFNNGFFDILNADYEQIKKLVPEIPNLFGYADWRWNNQQYDNYVNVLTKCRRLFWRLGDWDFFSQYLKRVEELKVEGEVTIKLIYNLGDISYFRGEYEQSRKSFLQVLTFYEQNKNYEELIHTYGFLARIEAILAEKEVKINSIGLAQSNEYLKQAYTMLAQVAPEAKSRIAARLSRHDAEVKFIEKIMTRRPWF